VVVVISLFRGGPIKETTVSILSTFNTFGVLRVLSLLRSRL